MVGVGKPPQNLSRQNPRCPRLSKVGKLPIAREARQTKNSGRNARICPEEFLVWKLLRHGARCRVRTCDPSRVKCVLFF